MYLIITALAAVVVTIIWYVNAPKDMYKLSLLCFIFWGATLMWLVDHVMAYLMEGGKFFEVTADATLLGVNVVLLGLVVWLIVLLVTDPKGVFNRLLKG
ncbi:MAG TPA: hypothetical protein GXX55_07075 [Firmicutes bacterium]|nr:hypothetical protein [Bacillota bacterium]